MRDDSAITVEYVPSYSIRPHPDNPRKGSVDAIAESIGENGVYRPIIVQRSTGHILAGNHAYQAMLRTGRTQIPVVFRDVNDQDAKKIVLADNRIADLGTYDDDLLISMINSLDGDLLGTGYTEDFLKEIEGLADESDRIGSLVDGKYSRATNAPHYEPTGERPSVSSLTDRSRTDQLIAEVEIARIPSPIKEFLYEAAHRHTVFSYSRIAEFYAHADPETQALMEQSALVIIDANDAIRYGYAKLAEALTGIRSLDQDDDA